MLYILEQHVYLQAKFSMSVGFDSSSSINGLDEALGCKFFSLSRICLIKDFCHVAREEEASRDSIHLIKN